MKDPAFLFYSDHFLMGCTDLTMEERGQYITLLCIQHQKGILTRKSIGLALGFSWDNVSEDLKSKFVENENGEIYNERLNLEIEKRRKFSLKQSENGKKGGRPPKEKEEIKEPLKSQKKANPKPKIKPKESLLVNVNVDVNKDEIIKGKSEILKIETIDENGKISDVGFDLKDVEPMVLDEVQERINNFVHPDLVMPDDFKPLWADWMEYRKAKKKKPYAVANGKPKYEQLAVNKFLELSENDPKKAAEMLEYTFYKNYEGFFKHSEIIKSSDFSKMKQEQKNDGFETNR